METRPAEKKGFPLANLLLIVLPLLVFAIIIYGRILSGQKGSDEPLEIRRYGMIGDFELIDQRGEPFRREDVEGKVWVANFIFTSCATECPLLSRRMRDIQERFRNDDRVILVSFSVDPRTDHPERLAGYARAFDAGEHWYFLTGEERVIEHLSAKGFMVTTPGSAPKESAVRRTRQLLHSEKIAVVDPLGVVRFYANGMDPRSSREVGEVVSRLLRSQG